MDDPRLSCSFANRSLSADSQPFEKVDVLVATHQQIAPQRPRQARGIDLQECVQRCTATMSTGCCNACSSAEVTFARCNHERCGPSVSTRRSTSPSGRVVAHSGTEHLHRRAVPRDKGDDQVIDATIAAGVELIDSNCADHRSIGSFDSIGLAPADQALRRAEAKGTTPMTLQNMSM